MSVAKHQSPDEMNRLAQKRRDDFWNRGDKNIMLGSCPECGRNIWTNDYHTMMRDSREPIYKCVSCRTLVRSDSIIPF